MTVITYRKCEPSTLNVFSANHLSRLFSRATKHGAKRSSITLKHADRATTIEHAFLVFQSSALDADTAEYIALPSSSMQHEH